MKTDALIIFTRNPLLGKVKTRLAKTIGDEKALAIYKDLLAHTKLTTQSLDCDLFVFYDKKIEENDIWSNEIYHKSVQSGENLGEKMQNAFQNLFKSGYQKCIIIGSDLFDLKEQNILQALKLLEKNEVVIGPAEDGGYYLLGLKKIIPAIFQNKKWGTPSVFADTMKDLENIKVNFTEELNDIDTFEDLQNSRYYKSLKTF